jgi:hypothetical protein
MSYHVSQPRRVSRRRLPAATGAVQYYPLPGPGVLPYQLLPLADVAPAPRDKTKELLMVLAVIVVIAAIMWWVDQQQQKELKPNRSRAKKQSTAVMAKNLYKRLEDRGGVSDTTMRSLKQLGRKA